jgi:hypothetical protein
VSAQAVCERYSARTFDHELCAFQKKQDSHGDRVFRNKEYVIHVPGYDFERSLSHTPHGDTIGQSGKGGSLGDFLFFEGAEGRSS